MGNSNSSIENQVKDIEGAMEALEKINDALSRYRTNVYKNEFSEDLPKKNDPDLYSSKRYAFMSYKRDIDWDSIRSTLDAVLEIPDVLSNKKEGISNAVTKMANMVVGQQEAFAFSKAFTWRVEGKDGSEYLYTAVCAATAIDSSKWGIQKGISCQAAMTFVFKADPNTKKANPKDKLEDPPNKEPLDKIVDNRGSI
jgi:hypothetical protein